MTEETIPVPRSVHATALAALDAAILTMQTTGQAIAQSIPELSSIRRRAQEAGISKEALDEIDQFRAMVSRTQVTLVRSRAAVVEAKRDFRYADPELTPINPNARRDSEKAFAAVTAYADRAGRALRGEK